MIHSLEGRIRASGIVLVAVGVFVLVKLWPVIVIAAGLGGPVSLVLFPIIILALFPMNLPLLAALLAIYVGVKLWWRPQRGTKPFLILLLIIWFGFSVVLTVGGIVQRLAGVLDGGTMTTASPEVAILYLVAFIASITSYRSVRELRKRESGVPPSPASR